MSLFISETIEWLKNVTVPFQVNGGTQISGGAQITGSLSVVIENNGLSEGQYTAGGSVYVLSGSVAVSSSEGGNHISGSDFGINIPIVYTSSLAAANPTAAQLHEMFPNTTTGSLVMVGSGSETWLAFKDIKGAWRTMTASFAA